MELNFAFFADRATVPPDGKLYILGGGFGGLALTQFPARTEFCVVAQFRFIAADADRAHTVEMRLVDGDGRFVIQPATLTFQAAGPSPSADGEVTIPTVTLLQPTFGGPGLYAVELWYLDERIESLQLRVLEVQQPASPPVEAPTA